MNKIIVNIPEEINDRLSEIAKRNGMTMGETMQKAFALLSIAERNKQNGFSIGVISEKNGSKEIINTINGI